MTIDQVRYHVTHADGKKYSRSKHGTNEPRWVCTEVPAHPWTIPPATALWYELESEFIDALSPTLALYRRITGLQMETHKPGKSGTDWSKYRHVRAPVQGIYCPECDSILEHKRGTNTTAWWCTECNYVCEMPNEQADL